MAQIILKIVPKSLWAEAEQSGTFIGAPVDQSDGFIHFSTPEQAIETAAKHFVSQDDLLIISFDAETMGDAMKWEVSRGGALFPHLYRSLDVSEALLVQALPLSSEGNHIFPEKFS